MGKNTERLYNGIIKENPTFVQMLGMCPTLAVTSSAINGAGMGLTTTCILVLSNFMISALRKVIPDKVRIPSYIVIIASFVTIIQFLLQAYLPSLNDSLGIYIPLIVVNCIILGRAEAYASKNKVLPSIFDGLGMGLGFTLGLTVIGAFRELIGKGSVFGFQIFGDDNLFIQSGGILKAIGNIFSLYTPITIFVLAPGAFFVLAFIIAFINHRNAKKREAAAGQTAGTGNCDISACMGCANVMCSGKLALAGAKNSDTTGKADNEKVQKKDSEADKAKVQKNDSEADKAKTQKKDSEADKANEQKNDVEKEKNTTPKKVPDTAPKVATDTSQNVSQNTVQKTEPGTLQNVSQNTVQKTAPGTLQNVSPDIEPKAAADSEENKETDEKPNSEPPKKNLISPAELEKAVEEKQKALRQQQEESEEKQSEEKQSEEKQIGEKQTGKEDNQVPGQTPAKEKASEDDSLESEIKLKETMAKIKKRKGKGGKR
jgi:electron transport complex protein RnfE